MGAAAFAPVAGELWGAESKSTPDYAALQKEINAVLPRDYSQVKVTPDCKTVKEWAKFPALVRLDKALDKVFAEVETTVVTDRPAIWLVYNLGFVVKTRESVFSVDLRHPRAQQYASKLDFALITHAHGDHFTKPFYQAMDEAGKTVVSNFLPNKGALKANKVCGYTREPKTFTFKDVTVTACKIIDHSPTLPNFTTPYEIKVGNYLIYDTGDCCFANQLNPSRKPDLWLMHPLCCDLRVDEGVRRFHPKLTVIAHINEFGHPINGCRWTWQEGLREKARCEKAGGPAVMPLWGDRVW